MTPSARAVGWMGSLVAGLLCWVVIAWVAVQVMA